MSLRDAFLADIVDRPDDDVSRLVSGDWLDDHGDPGRAEFIRVQCQLAALYRYAPARPALRRREQELFRLHGGRWLEEDDLAEWKGIDVLTPRYTCPLYRRGFLE